MEATKLEAALEALRAHFALHVEGAPPAAAGGAVASVAPAGGAAAGVAALPKAPVTLVVKLAALPDQVRRRSLCAAHFYSDSFVCAGCDASTSERRRWR